MNNQQEPGQNFITGDSFTIEPMELPEDDLKQLPEKEKLKSEKDIKNGENDE